jgi:hypothetical protein
MTKFLLTLSLLLTSHAATARLYIAPVSVSAGENSVNVPIRLVRTSLDTNNAVRARVQVTLPPQLQSENNDWSTSGAGIALPPSASSQCSTVGPERIECEVTSTVPFPIGAFTVAILHLEILPLSPDLPLNALVLALDDISGAAISLSANTTDLSGVVFTSVSRPHLIYTPASGPPLNNVTATLGATGLGQGFIGADLTNFPSIPINSPYTVVSDCRTPQAPAVFNLSQAAFLAPGLSNATLRYTCTPQAQAVTALMSCDEVSGGDFAIRQWNVTCPAGAFAIFANGFE